MAKLKKPTEPKIDTVTFRPDSRDGRKDYQISKEDARRLLAEGVIVGDATNGGYMLPYLKGRPGVRDIHNEYKMQQYRVPPERSNNKFPWLGRK